MQAKPTLSHSRQAEIRKEALTRAVTGLTVSNYPAIYKGFMEKGIPESEIKPRENVFTYEAWHALGRYVRRGEHGVKIVTFIDCVRENKETGEKETYSRPWHTAVFHVSQTEPLNGKGGDNGQ